MRTPKVTLPDEDPATKAAREREQRRAESARTEETQAWLLGATGRRNRRFGSLGGGSVPVYGAAPGRGGSNVGSTSGGSTSSGRDRVEARFATFDKPAMATLY